MHPILSVIIPLYNCEPFIKPCLDSILAQPLAPSDYEVIIVDDGSTDQSVAVASGYAARHGHIHLIRQENQGVACARNRALQAASGDYVTFVDADDMLVGGSLSTVLQLALETQAEMVKAAHTEVPQEATCSDYRSSSCTMERMSGEEAIVRLTKMKEGYCWGYLLSRRLIADHGICFPPQVSFMEDWAFITQALLHCQRLVSTDTLLYLYRRNSASCVATMTTGKLLQGCRSIELVARAARQTRGDVRSKLSANVCANINIVLWYTIHYRRIYRDKRIIARTLVRLLDLVDRSFIPRSLKPFLLFPRLYVILRHWLASRKW